MRHLILFFVLAIGTVSLFSSFAHADADRYSFDKAHTQILFFVNHLGFSNSQGEFHDYDGEILFDMNNPADSSVEVVIKTNSIDMDDEKWDDHMKNEDFFHVTEFPEMSFKSTNIELTGESTALITGDLTMLGVTKPVILDTTFNKAGRHPFNQKFVAGFSAKAVVKRSEWGMNYGLPMIGDDVQLVLEVEGIRQDKEGQEAVNQ
jgi:polyisoprenoid-binding protein YceI